MSTIKSYTDINQSKVLSKMLPLENADMHYRTIINGIARTAEKPKLGSIITEWDIPCWSLAALLNILPNEIITDNRFECHYQIDIRKYDGGNNTTFYQIAYGNNRGLSGSWHDMISTGEKENLIDACVAMIEKLHELNLL